MRHFTFLIGSLSLVLAGAGLHATLATTPRQEPPKAGPQHEVLQQMVGEWDALVDMGGPPITVRQSAKSLPGGLFVVGDLSGDFSGMIFHGHGIWGYDQRKNKYVSVWVDNFDSSLQVVEGMYEEKSKTLRLDGDGVGMDGKPATYHYVTTFIDKDTYHFELTLTPKETGQVTPVGEVRYTRRK